MHSGQEWPGGKAEKLQGHKVQAVQLKTVTATRFMDEFTENIGRIK